MVDLKNLRFPTARRPPRPQKTARFGNLRATELFCPRCKRSMPVRERLLLVTPEGDKYEYLCAGCGTSVGDRIDKGTQDPIIIR
jgi:hypothetical protein